MDAHREMTPKPSDTQNPARLSQHIANSCAAHRKAGANGVGWGYAAHAAHSSFRIGAQGKLAMKPIFVGKTMHP